MPKVPDIDLKLRNKYVVRATGQEGVLVGVQEEDGVCVCLLMIKGKVSSFFKEEIGYPPKIPAVVSPLAARIQKGLDSIARIPNAWVTARAGSGKTFMLINAIQKILTGKTDAGLTKDQFEAVSAIADPYKGIVPSILVTSFSNAAVSEIENRLAEKKLKVKVQGLHAYGYGICSKEGLHFNQFKYKEITLAHPKLFDPIMGRQQKISAHSLYEFCRLTMTPINNEEKMRMMCSLYGFNPTAKALEAAKVILKYSYDHIKTLGFDFTDMIWYPNMLDKVSLPKYDLVIIDEAQDLNMAQIMLVQKIAKRLVICGDDRQAIGMFHGADSRAMKMLIGSSENDIYYMSGCKRCAVKIVARAKLVVPGIEANRKELGIEAIISHKEMRERLRPGDLVISRNNSTLINECLKHLGRIEVAIESSVLTGIRKNITDLARNTSMRTEEFIEGYKQTFQDNIKSAPNDYDKNTLEDEFNTILNLAGGCLRVSDILRKIDQIRINVYNPDVVTFSTIHKAKGREAKRVFFLMTERSQCPNLRYCKNAEQVEQEWNLWYIGVTRAIDELYFSVDNVDKVSPEILGHTGMNTSLPDEKKYFTPTGRNDSMAGSNYIEEFRKTFGSHFNGGFAMPNGMSNFMSGYYPEVPPQSDKDKPRELPDIKDYYVPCPMPDTTSQWNNEVTKASKIKKKYILVPGEVVSQKDGQRHRITSLELANLYQVTFNECFTSSNLSTAGFIKATSADPLIILTPDPTGQYKIPSA